MLIVYYGLKFQVHDELEDQLVNNVQREIRKLHFVTRVWLRPFQSGLGQLRLLMNSRILKKKEITDGYRLQKFIFKSVY